MAICGLFIKAKALEVHSSRVGRCQVYVDKACKSMIVNSDSYVECESIILIVYSGSGTVKMRKHDSVH